MSEEKQIIMFWGKECPHCHAMMPLVERLEKEEGVKFEKLEVWHDEENAKKMRDLASLIRPACGGELGTPSFYNPKNGSVLCQEQTYEALKEWALHGSKEKKT